MSKFSKNFPTKIVLLALSHLSSIASFLVSSLLFSNSLFKTLKFHDAKLTYFSTCLHNHHISIQSLDSNLHDKNRCVNLSIYCNLFYNNFFRLSFLVTIFTIIVFFCRIKEILLNHNCSMQSFSMNLQITFEMYLAITIFAFKSLVTSL